MAGSECESYILFTDSHTAGDRYELMMRPLFDLRPDLLIVIRTHV